MLRHRHTTTWTKRAAAALRALGGAATTTAVADRIGADAAVQQIPDWRHRVGNALWQGTRFVRGADGQWRLKHQPRPAVSRRPALKDGYVWGDLIAHALRGTGAAPRSRSCTSTSGPT